MELDKVKEVVKYLQSNPIFIRIDKEEFGRSSYGFKHVIEDQLKSKYCSNGVIIMACYLLGCKMYDFIGLNCTIGISIDPTRDKKYTNTPKRILEDEQYYKREINIYSNSDEE